MDTYQREGYRWLELPPAWFPRQDTPCMNPRFIHLYETSNDRTGEARELCSSCPVTTECLTAALDQDEMVGIWGGKTPLERKRIKK